MSNYTANYTNKEFEPFSLERLMTTVFSPQKGERLALLFDFPDPQKEMKGLAFLEKLGFGMQKFAYEQFCRVFQEGLMEKLGLIGGELFAFKETGGSNLDMDDEVFDSEGRQKSLQEDIYPNYDIILCISKYSATAPMTAECKKHGFRGATMHGLNPIILNTGLAVDYQEVSEQAEKLRRGLTKAQRVKVEFKLNNGVPASFVIELGGQEAQKSHGLCPPGKPDIANLPAGEVYFVPTGASGRFPRKFEDGTIAILDVDNGLVTKGEFVQGEEQTLADFLEMVKEDPKAGAIGELGFGTQELPVCGHDIQDEKIFGTFHIATGRSDHLGGDITPDMFKHKSNAAHEDILFAPHKTAEIQAVKVEMERDGETYVLFQEGQPSEYLLSLRD